MTNKMRNAHELSKGERYALIPEKVARSDAYVSLTASALRLLTLALCKYNGSNNGDIALTQSQLRHYGFKSRDTLTRALKQLRETGLLVLTRQGGFANGGKIPNLYAFSWLRILQHPKLEIPTPAKASNAWAEYKIDRSPDKAVLPSTDPCGSVTPIPALSTRSSTGTTGRTCTDPPDNFLRSSPEGPPPSVGEDRGSSVR